MASADGVQFRVHTTFGSSDQATTPSVLEAMLIAVRCAFRNVASIARQLIAEQSMKRDHHGLLLVVFGRQTSRRIDNNIYIHGGSRLVPEPYTTTTTTMFCPLPSRALTTKLGALPHASMTTMRGDDIAKLRAHGFASG